MRRFVSAAWRMEAYRLKGKWQQHATAGQPRDTSAAEFLSIIAYVKNSKCVLNNQNIFLAKHSSVMNR